MSFQNDGDDCNPGLSQIDTNPNHSMIPIENHSTCSTFSVPQMQAPSHYPISPVQQEEQTDIIITNKNHKVMPQQGPNQNVWRRHVDEKSGKEYFYNVATRETRWKLPPQIMNSQQSISSQFQQQQHLQQQQEHQQQHLHQQQLQQQQQQEHQQQEKQENSNNIQCGNSLLDENHHEKQKNEVVCQDIKVNVANQNVEEGCETKVEDAIEDIPEIPRSLYFLCCGIIVSFNVLILGIMILTIAISAILILSGALSSFYYSLSAVVGLCALGFSLWVAFSSCHFHRIISNTYTMMYQIWRKYGYFGCHRCLFDVLDAIVREIMKDCCCCSCKDLRQVCCSCSIEDIQKICQSIPQKLSQFCENVGKLIQKSYNSLCQCVSPFFKDTYKNLSQSIGMVKTAINEMIFCCSPGGCCVGDNDESCCGPEGCCGAPSPKPPMK